MLECALGPLREQLAKGTLSWAARLINLATDQLLSGDAITDDGGIKGTWRSSL